MPLWEITPRKPAGMQRVQASWAALGRKEAVLDCAGGVLGEGVQWGQQRLVLLEMMRNIQKHEKCKLKIKHKKTLSEWAQRHHDELC